MENKLLEDLKRHVLYEFSFRGFNLLKEERGNVQAINDFIEKFKMCVEQQINKTIRMEGLPVDKVYTKENCERFGDIIGKDCFFNNFSIELKTALSDKKRYGGHTDLNLSLKRNDDGEVSCRPFINLSLGGKNETDLYYLISFGLGHELIHLYNEYCYLLKNPEKDLITNYKEGNYGDIYSTILYGGGTRKKVANALYLLNRLERNAYIGQLKQELRARKKEITDAQSAIKVIKSTESYAKLITIDNFLNFINSLDGTSNDDSKTVIKALNDIMKKNFKTIEQVRKYFVRRCEKWKKKYMVTASKIAFDVYNEGKIPLVPNTNEL